MATAAAHNVHHDAHDTHEPVGASHERVHLPSYGQTWDLLALTVALPGSMLVAFAFAVASMVAAGGSEMVGWSAGILLLVTLALGAFVAGVGSIYERLSA